MTSLEVFTRQPDFPRVDLSSTNAGYIGYMLRHEQSDRSYANMLSSSMRTLHITGHHALQICGINVDYSEDEYAAFCAGFAAFEYTSLLVNPQLYDGDLAVQKTKQLLIQGEAIADFELADRFAAWRETHVNTHGVIIDAGAERGETMKQLQARAIGAGIAREFQIA